jgi:hypothetical protein
VPEIETMTAFKETPWAAEGAGKDGSAFVVDCDGKSVAIAQNADLARAIAAVPQLIAALDAAEMALAYGARNNALELIRATLAAVTGGKVE